MTMNLQKVWFRIRNSGIVARVDCYWNFFQKMLDPCTTTLIVVVCADFICLTYSHTGFVQI